MARIPDIFARQRTEGRTGLMPFVTAGYPTLEVTEAVVPALEGALGGGGGIVELGFPFSDPLADGPVIAASMHKALASGVTPPAIFETVRRLRSRTGLGLVAMVSQSIAQRMGLRRFVGLAAEAGFDGLIIPDLDADGAGSRQPPLDALAREHGMTFTMLISPTTPARRLASIVARCTGFVYVMARVGITGERDGAADVAGLVEAVRRSTDLPIAVGFGISNPQQVAAATAVADAAIVGSAIVRRMGESPDPVAAAVEFTGTLAAALSERSTRPWARA